MKWTYLRVFSRVAVLFLQILQSGLSIYCRIRPFLFLDFGPVKEYLGYINYFVPVGFILSVTETWLVAVGVYYAYQAYLRWIKAFG